MVIMPEIDDLVHVGVSDTWLEIRWLWLGFKKIDVLSEELQNE